MRCIECGATLDVTSEPIDMEFRGENLTIRGVEHYKCPDCGEIAFDSAMDSSYEREVDSEYRRRCGLLSPQEIRSFRNDLGLTQEQFQILLGVGKLSVCRWETGRLAQSKTVDNLIRAYKSCPRLVSEALERTELSRTSRAVVSAKPMECASLSEYANHSMKERALPPANHVAVVATSMTADGATPQPFPEAYLPGIAKKPSDRLEVVA
ncbi:MAG: type II toxin-antitoxin system MqsA family antitoxin [Eggerthellaceae bacterium]|nr:type II toxin-antitoxin system MqsA family antitoxin [Eggerthellaceae bacterium]